MPYLDSTTLDTFRGNLNLGIYFFLDVGGGNSLRLWTAYTRETQDMLNVPSASGTYRAFRLLDNWPDVEVMINGGAERGEFSLEGVSQRAQDDMAGINPPVQGKPVWIGMAAHDRQWQPSSPIVPVTMGIADFWAMSFDTVRGGDAPTRRITLSVGFGETGRTRPRRAIYSAASQQMLFPGDTFCNDVPRYNRGYLVAWPRF